MPNEWLDSTVAAYKRFFKLSASPIVYEVGSRDGKDGIELAERILDGPAEQLNQADVVLFEPNPPQIKLICDAYPKATVMPFAALDKDGTADFLAIEDETNIAAVGSSTLDLNRRDFRPGNKSVITVQTRRLEAVVNELKHSSIDIMKIDAEGYSYEVLRGLGNRLADVKVLHVETEMAGFLVTNKTNQEVFAFMRDNGFLCYALAYEWRGIEDQVWVNAGLIR